MFYNREECLLSRSLRSREREGGGLVGMNGIKGGRLRERFQEKGADKWRSGVQEGGDTRRET